MSDTEQRAQPHAVLFSHGLEPTDDGFLARCPAIPAAFAEGDTIEEAIFNGVAVIKMIAAYRAERGEGPPVGVIDVTPDTQLAIAIPIAIPA